MKIDVDKMNSVRPAAYLTADKCQLYRSVMRVLYKEKEAYNSQLSAGSILKHLKGNELSVIEGIAVIPSFSLVIVQCHFARKGHGLPNW